MLAEGKSTEIVVFSGVPSLFQSLFCPNNLKYRLLFIEKSAEGEKGKSLMTIVPVFVPSDFQSL